MFVGKSFRVYMACALISENASVKISRQNLGPKGYLLAVGNEMR